MEQKYQQFRSQVYGQFIEKEDASNYAQCMDLIFAWLDFLGIPRETIRHLYAYQAWTLANDLTRKYFDLIPNSATNKPQTGDIPVFDTKVGPAGHISIETGKSNTKDAVTLDQNWGTPKSVREVVHGNYYGVLGWLHPKVQIPSLDEKMDKIKNIANSSGTSVDKIKNIDTIIHN